mmetsp:Transcript_3970/g.9999  ORF Transcript_3970/g.9999 Transcript_3970/m.9999 type:complete len:393 (-) Transcript_3970:151-1329(-)
MLAELVNEPVGNERVSDDEPMENAVAFKGDTLTIQSAMDYLTDPLDLLDDGAAFGSTLDEEAELQRLLSGGGETPMSETSKIEEAPGALVFPDTPLKQGQEDDGGEHVPPVPHSLETSNSTQASEATNGSEGAVMVAAPGTTEEDEEAEPSKRLPAGHREVILQRRGRYDPLGLDVSVKGSTERVGEPGVTVTVLSVKPGSLAHRGGIEVGDTITEIQGLSTQKIYRQAQCLELLREPQVRLVLAGVPPTEPEAHMSELPPTVVVGTGPRLVVQGPDEVTRKYVKEVMVPVIRGGKSASMGLEVLLSEKEAVLTATIKHVKRDGLGFKSGLRGGDRVVSVNGRSVADLPCGSSGRIYLFRLLGVGDVQIVVRRVVNVTGYEDREGNFTPTKL